MNLITSQPDKESPNAGAAAHLLLTHGASQPVTSPFFEMLISELARHGLTVHRFSFSYMLENQRTGKRRPPPRIETLQPGFLEAVAVAREAAGDAPLFIGGKSMGGRIASVAADVLFKSGGISGLVALSYPFHPPKKPDQLRTAHLEGLSCPMLIVQGERDPFGTPSDVEGYHLSKAISFHWCPDGDHDLKPRKRSGHTWAGNLSDGADAIAQFIVTTA